MSFIYNTHKEEERRSNNILDNFADNCGWRGGYFSDPGDVNL